MGTEMDMDSSVGSVSVRIAIALLISIFIASCSSSRATFTPADVARVEASGDPNQVLATWRTYADQPLTDQERSQLTNRTHTIFLASYEKEWKSACDGNEVEDPLIKSQADGCNHMGTELDLANDPTAGVAYYWKACQIASADRGFYCENVTDRRHHLSISLEREIWLQCGTTQCFYSLADSFLNEQPKDPVAAASYAKQGCEEASPEGTGRYISAACGLAERLGAKQNISRELALAEQQSESFEQERVAQNEMYRERNEEVARNMAQDTAIANAITHNGNLISETANTQVSATQAVGAASRHIRVAPQNATATASADQTQTPLVGSTSDSSAQSSSSNSGGSAGLSGEVFAQNTDPNQYAASLASTCVASFWDSSYYGWMSFRNNCGQPIHLEIVALNGSGAFGHGGSMDIAAGGTHNVGQSPSEVNAAGGGYSLYVCPAGYVAVDNSGNSIQAPGQNFRCKRW